MVILALCAISSVSQGSTTYGVNLHTHPRGKYGVKYSEPKTYNILPRPYELKYKPVPNHQYSHPHEATYELVYEPVARIAPHHPSPEVKHHVIHIHHYHKKEPY